jgi:hypothetical protein
MLKKKWAFSLFFVFSFFVSGCSAASHELYEGDALNIGVIGDSPKVAEENIFFSDLTFEAIENDTRTVSANHDALFIMHEKLDAADAEKYVEVYKQLNIPTFFIGTTKAHIPFVFEDATYSKVTDVSPKTYAAGYLYDHGNNLGEQWRFTKEDDNEEKITEEEINEIYSEIFRTISTIKENRIKTFPNK